MGLPGVEDELLESRKRKIEDDEIREDMDEIKRDRLAEIREDMDHEYPSGLFWEGSQNR